MYIYINIYKKNIFHLDFFVNDHWYIKNSRAEIHEECQYVFLSTYKRLETIYTSQVHVQDMHHINTVHVFKTKNRFILRLAVSECSS